MWQCTYCKAWVPTNTKPAQHMCCCNARRPPMFEEEADKIACTGGRTQHEWYADIDVGINRFVCHQCGLRAVGTAVRLTKNQRLVMVTLGNEDTPILLHRAAYLSGLSVGRLQRTLETMESHHLVTWLPSGYSLTALGKIIYRRLSHGNK